MGEAMSFSLESLPEMAQRACPPARRLAAWTALVVALALLCGCAGRHRPPQARQPPVFAVVADIQYGNKDTAGARHFRAAMCKLDECVANLAQRDLAFIVQLGDVVDGYENDSARSAADFDAVLRVLDRQKAPVFHVLGNHCLRVGKKTLLHRYGLKRFYYDFEVRAAPGWRFVVLDGNDAGYGIVSEKQLTWFRAVLARAAARGERVICFCHFALLKEAARDHRMAKPEPLLEALDRAGCVVAWFAGHDHAGGYAKFNGIHHVTVKGMIEASDENSFSLFELHPNQLRELGAGAEPARAQTLNPASMYFPFAPSKNHQAE